MAGKCVACRQGFFWECRATGNCGVEDGDSSSANVSASDSVPLIGAGDLSVLDEEPEEVELRTYKDDSALRDQQSTGRKRAAKLYPLDYEAPCEWQMKKNCGGGKYPITGCIAGTQTDRHHGPEKNTLNNDRGNVHRICSTCHNRWHTLNDEGYVWTDIQEPHEPRIADAMDLAESEEFWAGRKLIKAKD